MGHNRQFGWLCVREKKFLFRVLQFSYSEDHRKLPNTEKTYLEGKSNFSVCTVLPLKFFATASDVFYGDFKYFLQHSSFSIRNFCLFLHTTPLSVLRKSMKLLSSLPFLRLRLVMILAKDSLLAIERPVVVLPFFTPFMNMFPLIITLIKAKECLNSMKHIAIVPHSYLSQCMAVFCLPLFEEKDSLFWHYNKYEGNPVQLQPLNSIANNSNSYSWQLYKVSLSCLGKNSKSSTLLYVISKIAVHHIYV